MMTAGNFVKGSHFPEASIPYIIRFDISIIQPVLSRSSSWVVPIVIMSQLTQPIHICFGLTLLFLPGGTIFNVFLPTYSLSSRLSTCPNHVNIAFQHPSGIFSTFSITLMSSFLDGLLVCGRMTIYTSVSLSLPVSSRGS